MKKYSLTDRWENDKPVNTFDFDTIDELQQIDIVKKAMQHPDFYQLSIEIGYVNSYYPPNYSTFNLITELHDGYIHFDLGFLTKNPIDKFNYGFSSGAKTPPAVCLNFDPIKELGVPLFDYYNWIVYKLIGSSGAHLVIDLASKGVDIKIIRKLIESEKEYQSKNPRLYPEYNRIQNIIDKSFNKHNKE